MIGASADIERDDKMHKALEWFFGPEKLYIHKIWDGDWNYVRIFTDIKPKIEYVKSYGKKSGTHLDWNVVKQSSAKNVHFNNFIAGIVKLLYPKKILVLAEHKFQVKWLYKLIKEFGMDVEILFGKQKTHQDANVIVATTKKVAKGYDVSIAKNWDYKHFDIVIMCSDMQEIEQIFGRGFRTENPIILDFVHDNHVLFKHSTTRLNWCKERNAQISTYYVRFNR
jgi:hypothetical protein